MPYIKKEHRPQYEEVVESLTDAMLQMRAGDLNYIIFAATRRYIKHTAGMSYEKLRDVLAELDECRSELRRRLMFGHEDSKILENGDVE